MVMVSSASLRPVVSPLKAALMLRLPAASADVVKEALATTMGLTPVDTGVVRGDVLVPSPSWPLVFWPQHMTCGEKNGGAWMTQVWKSPVVILITSLDIPLT